MKLDEIIRNSHVRNSFVGIEHLSDEELEELPKRIESATRRHGRSAVQRTGRRSHRAADKASEGGSS